MQWKNRDQRQIYKVAQNRFWEPWFAWFPTEVDGYWYWLETIWRKRRLARYLEGPTAVWVYCKELPEGEYSA